MSLPQLIAKTFAAEDPYRLGLQIHKGDRYYDCFTPATVQSFGWNLSSLICRPITLKKRRHYSLFGVGNIACKDLRAVFYTAGFSDIFVFTTVADRVKRHWSNYCDHVFYPHTAKLHIRVGLSEGSNQPDWNKLNNGVSNYLLMAVMKRAA